MRKIILLIALCICMSGLQAQITLDNTYNGSTYMLLVKLQISGYKYVRRTGNTIDLYNINHSLFKTMTIPPVFGSVQNLQYVSETLFDSDNLVEYAVNTNSAQATNRNTIYIFKENGTQLFKRDSASLPGPADNGVFYNQDGIYFDGVNTKMKIHCMGAGLTSANLLKTEIYTLPGTMPCSECSSGTVTGISQPNTPGNPGSAVFYPNPVTDQLKLKYELPQGYKTAEINIYDIQGKLIENFRVTNTFDFIYLPSDYNNGLYLYALVVDGKTIKTEKVILDK